MIPINEQTSVTNDINNLDRLVVLFAARKKLRAATKCLDEAEQLIKSNTKGYIAGKIIDIHNDRYDITVQWQEIENEIEMLF